MQAGFIPYSRKGVLCTINNFIQRRSDSRISCFASNLKPAFLTAGFLIRRTVLLTVLLHVYVRVTHSKSQPAFLIARFLIKCHVHCTKGTTAKRPASGCCVCLSAGLCGVYVEHGWGRGDMFCKVFQWYGKALFGRDSNERLLKDRPQNRQSNPISRFPKILQHVKN